MHVNNMGTKKLVNNVIISEKISRYNKKEKS